MNKTRMDEFFPSKGKKQVDDIGGEKDEGTGGPLPPAGKKRNYGEREPINQESSVSVTNKMEVGKSVGPSSEKANSSAQPDTDPKRHRADGSLSTFSGQTEASTPLPLTDYEVGFIFTAFTVAYDRLKDAVSIYDYKPLGEKIFGLLGRALTPAEFDRFIEMHNHAAQATANNSGARNSESGLDVSVSFNTASSSSSSSAVPGAGYGEMKMTAARRKLLAAIEGRKIGADHTGRFAKPFGQAAFHTYFKGLNETQLNVLAYSKTWTYHYSSANILYAQCTGVHDNACGLFYEATLFNFSPADMNKFDTVEQWFKHFPQKFEHRCRACVRTKTLDSMSKGDVYLKNLGHNHHAIHRTDKITGKSDMGLAHLKERIGKRCPVTGAELNGEKGHPFCVSIDSMKLQRAGNNYDIDELDDIQIIAAFANIRQSGIDHLGNAFLQLFNGTSAFYADEDHDEENAAMASLQQRPIPKRVKDSGGRQADEFRLVPGKIKGKRDSVRREIPRDNDFPNSQAVVDFLEEANMRCATSYNVLSLEAGARSFTLDRKVDSIGHTRANTEAKNMMFVGRQKLSHIGYLTLYLFQNRTEPLTDKVRAAATADLAQKKRDAGIEIYVYPVINLDEDEDD